MNRREQLKAMIRADMVKYGSVQRHTLTLLCESRYHPRTLMNEVRL